MKTIEEVLTHGYEFRMGKYLSDGWSLFRKGAGNYIGFTLVFLAMVFFASVIPFVNYFVTILEYILFVGIYIYTRKLINGGGEFSDFFEGFNNIGPIILYSLVILALTLPVILLFILSFIPFDLLSDINMAAGDAEYLLEEIAGSFYGSETYIMVSIILMMIYFFYIYISYSLTLVLIADRKMPFMQAMKVSRKLVGKHFFSYLGMFILLGILISFGVILTCGLGILVAIPYVNTVMFAIYEDILGPEEDVLEKKLEEFGGTNEA